MGDLGGRIPRLRGCRLLGGPGEPVPADPFRGGAAIGRIRGGEWRGVAGGDGRRRHDRVDDRRVSPLRDLSRNRPGHGCGRSSFATAVGFGSTRPISIGPRSGSTGGPTSPSLSADVCHSCGRSYRSRRGSDGCRSSPSPCTPSLAAWSGTWCSSGRVTCSGSVGARSKSRWSCSRTPSSSPSRSPSPGTSGVVSSGRRVRGAAGDAQPRKSRTQSSAGWARMSGRVPDWTMEPSRIRAMRSDSASASSRS